MTGSGFKSEGGGETKEVGENAVVAAGETRTQQDE